MQTHAPFVLVIGNTPTSCKIIETSLRRKGCTVLSYKQPSEALKALRQGSIEGPDVAFVDLALAEMDSYTVIKELQTYRRIKIIGIDPQNRLLTRLKAWLSGVHHLPKPFTEQQLAKLVLGHTTN